MPRAMWSGAISFGLVTVPVKLYAATSSHNVSFHQLDRETGERIRYQRVAERSQREVEYSDIVKGYEISDGRYVVIEPEELEAVAPEGSRTIEITDFVELSEIDPIAWSSTYYLAPASDVGAEKPYRLLLEAMRTTGRVAIARFVMRGKQYLATIRPLGDALALEAMHFADEIRPIDELPNLPKDVELSEREVAIAEQLIESLTTKWEPERYTDTYRDAVMALIERKAEGEEIVIEPVQEASGEVVDLMAALQASVEAARKREAGGAQAMQGKGAAASGKAAAADSKAAQAATDGGEAGDLIDLTKEELYERAAEAGVKGRSKMTKEELAEAISKAS